MVANNGAYCWLVYIRKSKNKNLFFNNHFCKNVLKICNVFNVSKPAMSKILSRTSLLILIFIAQ